MLADLKNVLQNEKVENIPHALCSLLGEKTFSCVVLFDSNFRTLSRYPLNGAEAINERIKGVDLLKEYKSGGFFILPLKAQSGHTGTLVLYKEGVFSRYEVDLIESAFCVLSTAMLYIYHEKTDEHLRKVSEVKAAIDTLSYSEFEAVLAVFNELIGTEGLIVASKIAEKAKVTRSVIANALRKLESAGIAETRSLGVKGTYIKILNENLLDELRKYLK